MASCATVDFAGTALTQVDLLEVAVSSVFFLSLPSLYQVPLALGTYVASIRAISSVVACTVRERALLGDAACICIQCRLQMVQSTTCVFGGRGRGASLLV